MNHAAHNTLFADACYGDATNRAGLVKLLKAAWLWLKLAITVHRERQTLGAFSYAELADLGLSYEDAKREASRPFWDLPNNR